MFKLDEFQGFDTLDLNGSSEKGILNEKFLRVLKDVQKEIELQGYQSYLLNAKDGTKAALMFYKKSWGSDKPMHYNANGSFSIGTGDGMDALYRCRNKLDGPYVSTCIIINRRLQRIIREAPDLEDVLEKLRAMGFDKIDNRLSPFDFEKIRGLRYFIERYEDPYKQKSAIYRFFKETFNHFEETGLIDLIEEGNLELNAGGWDVYGGEDKLEP